MTKRMIKKLILSICLVSLLTACSDAEPEKAPSADKKSTNYELIEWTDLMPKDDLDAILNAPEIDHSGGEAPFSLKADTAPPPKEQEIADKVQGKNIETEAESRYQAALVSQAVRPEFEGRSIKLPGYVVPLGFNERNEVAEFFLVPFFGACIHVPPPPPNQIIHVTYPDGIRDHQIHEPFWIEGTLAIKNTTHQLGRSAYSMRADRVALYSSEPDPLLKDDEAAEAAMINATDDPETAQIIEEVEKEMAN